jgi:hypothetical protein
MVQFTDKQSYHWALGNLNIWPARWKVRPLTLIVCVFCVCVCVRVCFVVCEHPMLLLTCQPAQSPTGSCLPWSSAS